jgi:hypothetical protein
MPNRTWIGGGNNKASNPNDWSPTGAPQAGDSLILPQGVINISANDLKGDTLSIPPGSDNIEPIEINTSKNARLNLAAPGSRPNFSPIDVNVDGKLRFTADIVALDKLSFSGGTIQFIGSSTFSGSTQVFDDRLAGSGTLNLISATHFNEHTEINGKVGRGLTFNLRGGGPPFTSLQIDDPSEFHAVIDFAPAVAPAGFGYVAFMGLHVTRADLRNDMLRMFDGNKLVDTTRLSLDFSVRPNGAVHQWRKDPPRKLSVGPGS